MVRMAPIIAKLFMTPMVEFDQHVVRPPDRVFAVRLDPSALRHVLHGEQERPALAAVVAERAGMKQKRAGAGRGILPDFEILQRCLAGQPRAELFGEQRNVPLAVGDPDERRSDDRFLVGVEGGAEGPAGRKHGQPLVEHQQRLA